MENELVDRVAKARIALKKNTPARTNEADIRREPLGYPSGPGRAEDRCKPGRQSFHTLTMSIAVSVGLVEKDT